MCTADLSLVQGIDIAISGPSVMLSELLNVHMEDLLVKKNAVPVMYDIEQCYAQDAQKRFMAYYKKMYQLVA